MINVTNILKDAPHSIRSRYEGLATIEDRKDYHPEANVQVHVDIVATRCAVVGDIDLVLAAILHDICKLETAEINENTGNITSPGHEKAAAALIATELQIQDWILRWGGKIDIVQGIVLLHMRMKVFDSMKLSKQRRMINHPCFKKLQAFRFADNMLLSDDDAINKMFDVLKWKAFFANLRWVLKL